MKTNNVFFRHFLLAMTIIAMLITIIGCKKKKGEENAEISIYKQWQFLNVSNDKFSALVYDLSEKGAFQIKGKPSEEYAKATGLSVDKWYLVSNKIGCTITMNENGTSGLIEMNTMEIISFSDLTATTITFEEKGEIHHCKVVPSKITTIEFFKL